MVLTKSCETSETKTTSECSKELFDFELKEAAQKLKNLTCTANYNKIASRGDLIFEFEATCKGIAAKK